MKGCILLLLVLAAGNARTPRKPYNSVQPGQVLAQTTSPGAARYRICADVEKPKGQWGIRVDVTEDGKTRYSFKFASKGTIILQCPSVELRATDTISLISSGRLQGKVVASLEVTEDGP